MLSDLRERVFPLEFVYDEGKKRWYADQVIEHHRVRFVLDWSIPERAHAVMPKQGEENLLEAEVTRILFENHKMRSYLVGVKIIGPVVI